MPNCTNYARNKKRCTCTYEPCPRKGECCECVAYHLAHEEVPGCFFTREGEAGFDRSIGHFMRDRRG
ncbi:MAG: DUF6485 family protein [Candidatus Omnitrophica bacterium]|nr:DUF6485 family protein [Candidatus Omnitrophota bacterium]